MNHLKLYQDFFKSIFEQASDKISIKIEVKTKDGDIVEFPNFKVSDKSGKQVAAGRGDDSGVIEFKVLSGTYDIIIGSTGYEKFEKEYKFESDQKVEIILKSKELKEVTIENKKLVIEIRSKEKKKEPLKNSKCEILDDEENQLKVNKTSDGVFEFLIPGVGNFTIRCRAEGYETHQSQQKITKEDLDEYETGQGVFRPIIYLKKETGEIEPKGSKIEPKTTEEPSKKVSTRDEEIELDESYLDKFIARCPNLKAVMNQYGIGKYKLRIFVGEKGGKGGTFTQNKVKLSMSANRGMFGGRKGELNLIFAHKVTMKGGYNDSYSNLAIQKVFGDKKSFDKSIKEQGGSVEQFEKNLEKGLREIVGSLAKIGEGYVHMEDSGFWFEIFGLNPDQTLRVIDLLNKY